ncbi:MAG: DNA mismatch repair protein MutS [Epsilonproteobacteria bacterium]|nr:DNA mismatch repair protein MutS [Campylobacterota bacterium]
MRVFLMHKDKNFTIEQKFSSHSNIIMSDLELDVLLNAMSRDDEFLYDVSKTALLKILKTQEEIIYRQEILKDCLKNPQVARDIYGLTLKSILNKQQRWLGVFGRYPSSLLSSSVSLLDMYFELLKDLRKIADTNIENFNSNGFKRFFSMIQKELDDEYIDEVKKYLKELKFKDGILLSARLGTANKGINYTLRRDNLASKSWFRKMLAKKQKEYSHALHPRDDAGAKVLRNLRDAGLNGVAISLSKTAEHIDNFFISLRRELAFYMGCLNLEEKLKELKASIVFPKIYPMDKRVYFAKDLYDISLALIMGKNITANNINANEKTLFFITGANQGGKTTFLRSVGLAQLMSQCGMFTPALSFETNICSGIFTHFKKEEDRSMKSGKFDEELARMNDIVDNISPNAVVIFNESFASTNEAEGSQIASQITKALIEKNIKVIFVTHMFELVNFFYQNDYKNAIYLRANREEDGSRDFKIKEAKPLHTSFAKDIYDSIFI